MSQAPQRNSYLTSVNSRSTSTKRRDRSILNFAYKKTDSAKHEQETDIKIFNQTVTEPDI